VNPKKLASKLLISLLVVIFVFSQTPVIYGADEIDQYCSNNSGAWSIIKGHSDISQTFVPTQNRLARVGIYIRGEGGGTIYLRLQKGSTTIDSGSTNEPNGGAWVYVDFDDISLDAGETYRIKLTTPSTTAGWYRSSMGDASCCDSGSAYLDGEKKNYDWNFGTWGWTYAPPEDPGGDDDGSQPVVDNDNDNDSDNNNQQDGITEGTGEEPSDEVSFEIDPPSDLEASDLEDDQGGVIKLTWKKSNTNSIDGYYIFRSTDKDEGYKNIARAKKTVKQYLDKEAETGTPYYYLIRSYRNDDQSPDSNRAKSTAVDNLAPNTPENFVIATQQDDRLIFKRNKNSEED